MSLVGKAREDEEAGSDPEPVVVPNGPRPELVPEPGTEPVPLEKILLEPFFVDVGENGCLENFQQSYLRLSHVLPKGSRL